ncbi:hypothetical protein [Lacticaseibacillus nasuensis]|jgi:PTS system galactitol-specific IIB component|uniref:PTS EIIB type-2 domain-containing protein n=1 Tax=Lacticaseibacillus nasuensis JCM 17158 TaxID=1291734 RepID=A0A0R1JGV4_9LACO|nr:hypothetical protein [Lacticaseibacillus nasuensis]KRK70509.1 hypothetical protein FD02_GL000580 [Lacticaseibacillus nasuensis JCM 17158]MCX2456271.1 hypothetical protein [Lacticaseibacillus nasuensis]
MNTKHVLVACGSGIVTSTIVMAKISREIQARGWTGIELTQGTLSDVYAQTADYDLVVTTTPLEAGPDERIISALALLAGDDTAAFFAEFAHYLSLD